LRPLPRERRTGAGARVPPREKGTAVRPSKVLPTGVERTFGAEEIIVSTTDRKGRLT